MSSTVCLHANYEDTGELRNVTTCKKRGSQPNWQPVFKCLDCGLYFAGVARHKVSPPPSFEALKQIVQLGRLTRADLNRYGYLTPEQRAELEAVDACEHQHRTPIMVTFRCSDCGRTWMEQVEVLREDPRQDATTIPTQRFDNAINR